ncbi:MAG: preprotein translocase subunit SecG [Nitrospinae bacterium]|nr:preprotein translocase subunit SecG [Nitrospinota bacterium]
MLTLMILLHVSVCLALIVIVLFQSGKGASIGAAFGGSSQTVFGSRGPASFLHKLTTVAAVIFMLTSLGLTIYKVRLGKGSIVTTQGRAPAPPQSPPSEAPAGR